MRVEIWRVESGTSFWTTGQDRTKKERRPIDFAIDMFGEGRKVSESTIVPMSWMTGKPWQTGVSKRWDIEDVYRSENTRRSAEWGRSLWMNALEDPPRGLYHIVLVDQSVTTYDDNRTEMRMSSDRRPRMSAEQPRHDKRLQESQARWRTEPRIFNFNYHPKPIRFIEPYSSILGVLSWAKYTVDLYSQDGRFRRV